MKHRTTIYIEETLAARAGVENLSNWVSRQLQAAIEAGPIITREEIEKERRDLAIREAAFKTMYNEKAAVDKFLAVAVPRALEDGWSAEHTMSVYRLWFRDPPYRGHNEAIYSALSVAIAEAHREANAERERR